MGQTGYFDERAKTWDADPDKWARAFAVADGIAARVPLGGGMVALEYGCGTGLLSFALQAKLGQIVLADSSPGMLAVLDQKIAAAGATNMRSLKLDLAVDPSPPDRYDLVCSLMTLHHVEDVGGLLAKLHALMKSPGYLCVADLDAEDGSFHGPDFTGHRGFDRQTLGGMATHAGFENVSFSTVFCINKPGSPGQKDFPVFLMVAERR
jgi:cyclopropane fatty-acyl-phospholipid synthase-like methyltransferase